MSGDWNQIKTKQNKKLYIYAPQWWVNQLTVQSGRTSSCNLCLCVRTDLADLLLGGFEGLDDAVQLDATGEQALLQLRLLLLQPAQVRLGAAQLVLLAAEVWLLGADLALQGWNLEQKKTFFICRFINCVTVKLLHIFKIIAVTGLVCLLEQIKAAVFF